MAGWIFESGSWWRPWIWIDSATSDGNRKNELFSGSKNKLRRTCRTNALAPWARYCDVVTLTLPTRLGRYELLASLGSGGMATVYLARHEGPQGYERLVALKLLHPHMRDDPQAVVAFIQEARVASELRHPNIVQVLDVDDLPEGLFMVMEQVEGGSLSALGRSEYRPPLPISLRLLTDVLAGLHHAHEHRDIEGRPLHIVHRDFTPQNILVGVNGIAKLADFGIAKVLGANQRTTTGVVKGKVSYMAPEQAEGRAVDARTDIWAAGVVAWELVTKRRLYVDENEVAILLKIVRERPPRARHVRPDVSPELDEAIARALEPDPSRRYASADAFRQALIQAFPDIADLQETSAFVRQAFEDSLTARKQTISQSIARSSNVSSAHALSETDGVTLTTRSERRRSTTRAVIVGLGVAALLSAGAAAFAISRPTSPTNATVPPEPPPAPAHSTATEPGSATTVSVASVEVPRAPPRETAQSTPSARPTSRGRPPQTPRTKTQQQPKPGGTAELPKLLGSPYEEH